MALCVLDVFSHTFTLLSDPSILASLCHPHIHTTLPSHTHPSILFLVTTLSFPLTASFPRSNKQTLSSPLFLREAFCLQYLAWCIASVWPPHVAAHSACTESHPGRDRRPGVRCPSLSRPACKTSRTEWWWRLAESNRHSTAHTHHRQVEGDGDTGE